MRSLHGLAPKSEGAHGTGASPSCPWAAGGSGGNFGLITRYEFANLPTAPQHAELIVLAWDWADIVAGGGPCSGGSPV